MFGSTNKIQTFDSETEKPQHKDHYIVVKIEISLESEYSVWS